LPSLKDQVIAAIKKLPEDVDIADIMAELYTIQREDIIARKPQLSQPKVESVPRRAGRPKKES
jgi:hypothetical protein